MAYKDPENTLIMETTKGRVVIKLRPGPRPRPCRAHQGAGARRASMTASSSTASSTASWRRAATRTGTGMGGSDLPDLKAEFNAQPHVRGVCSMARSRTRTRPTASSSSASTTPASSTAIHGLGRGEKAWRMSTLAKGEPPRNPGQDRLHEGDGRRGRALTSPWTSGSSTSTCPKTASR